MSSREFAEWYAYAQIEPFGPARADLRIALLTALTAEIHRDPKKRSKPYTVTDFMPFWQEPEEEEEAEPSAVYAKMKSWAAMFKKKDADVDSK